MGLSNAMHDALQTPFTLSVTETCQTYRLILPPMAHARAAEEAPLCTAQLAVMRLPVSELQSHAPRL